jgi:hypothetical protein
VRTLKKSGDKEAAFAFDIVQPVMRHHLPYCPGNKAVARLQSIDFMVVDWFDGISLHVFTRRNLEVYGKSIESSSDHENCYTNVL